MTMKIFVVTLDRKIRDLVTRIVLAWEARYDYEKHKMDAFVAYSKKRTVLFLSAFAIVAPGLTFFSGEIVGAAWLFVIAIPFVWIVIYFETKHFEDKKRLGDELRQLTQNAQSAEVVNEVTRMMFEKTRRERFFIATTSFGVAWVLASFVFLAMETNVGVLVQWVAIVLDNVATSIGTYIIYVEDALPPKKKKEAKKSVTDLVMSVWRSLVGQPATAV